MSKPLKVIFLGPPGAGKGTQAKIASGALDLFHISTGEMLRSAVAAGTSLGKRVAEIMNAGQLVSDKLMVDIIRERIAEPDCRNGFILDGFPRTVAQAKALASMLAEGQDALTHVVSFEITPDDLRARLENRRKEEARADDRESTQLERLRVYQEQTAPLLDFYGASLKRVNADGSIEEVAARVRDLLSS